MVKGCKLLLVLFILCWLGLPRFGTKHHNASDAGPFGADFSGPDDFDIPDDFNLHDIPFGAHFDYRLTRGDFKRFRKMFIWTTIDGCRLKLADIEDDHLYNIISLLRRRLAAIVHFEQRRYHLELLIDYLQTEYSSRGIKFITAIRVNNNLEG